MSADPAAAYRAAERALFARHHLTPRQRLVDLDAPKMRARAWEVGEGAPLLFLHGGGAFGSVFAPLVELLQAPGRRLIVVDRPGCGLSDPFDYRGVELQPHASSFVRGVLDALDIPKATIVANCAGGLFGLAFALAHPARVARLILVGAAAGTDPWLPVPSRLLGTRGINRALWSTVFKPGPRSTREVYSRLFAADIDNVDDVMLACALQASLLPGASESFLTLMERVADLGGLRRELDLREHLREIAAPTLFVAGTKSFFGPPSVVEAAAARMKDARVHVVEGAGHFTWLDAPRECADAIDAFIAPPRRAAA